MASWWAAVERAVAEFRDDNVTDWAAALTCYGILSVFPAMLMIVWSTKEASLVSDRSSRQVRKGREAAVGELGHRVVVVKRLARAVPPGAGAVVMATGVVSLCFPVLLHGRAVVAVLATRLARVTGERWKVDAAAVAFVLGLMLYGMVVRRFDFRQVVRGAGDHWVLGGALAISTLAGSALLEASAMGLPDTVRTALRIVTPWLGWAAAVVYLSLAAAEVIRPRLRFDVRRWSTVFPLGMAALATLHLSRVFHQGTLWDIGQVLSWLAFAVWLVVAAGSLRRARAIAAGPGRRP